MRVDYVDQGRDLDLANLTDDQFRQFAEHFKGLCEHLINKHSGFYHQMEKEDLRVVAELGLLDALRTFDPSRGVQLTTHVYWRIRGAITHYLADQSQTYITRIPRHVLDKRDKLAQFEDTYSAKHGYLPSRETILTSLGWPESTLDLVIQAGKLGTMGSELDGGNLEVLLEADTIPTELEEAFPAIDEAMLEQLVDVAIEMSKVKYPVRWIQDKFNLSEARASKFKSILERVLTFA